MRKKRGYVLAGGLALAIVATSVAFALTSGGDEETPPRQLELAGAPGPGVGDEAMLGWAETVLAGQCMVARDFPFAVAAPEGAEATPQERLAEMYGTTDVAVARERGYGIGPRFRRPQPQADDANRRYITAMTPEENRTYSLAYFGDDKDMVRVEDAATGTVQYSATGCLADARRYLYGDLQQWASLDTWALSLDNRAYATVTASADYRRRLATWQKCMDRAGVPAQSPAASRERIAGLVREQGAEQAETTAAVAEAGCNGSSGLTSASITAHRAELDRVLAAEKANYTGYREMRRTALAKAKSLQSDPYRRP
ncbi:hypothetical protein [Actinoplanes sp. GCM10030250]|uniref:hypothetical protein n=1 Tax=Actinoplanes sp. GCM10030250 TaxID=3273376 RepID=UPI003620DE6D